MLHSLSVTNNSRVTAAERDPSLEPLNARSIVLSVLLGAHPPRMPVGRILEFTALFDLPDGTVRTALSRMVAAGDLVNDDGVYRLAARLVKRQVQQDAGSQPAPGQDAPEKLPPIGMAGGILPFQPNPGDAQQPAGQQQFPGRQE